MLYKLPNSNLISTGLILLAPSVYNQEGSQAFVFIKDPIKSYGTPTDDLLAFYCSVICSILEYGAEIWNGLPKPKL